MLGSPFATETVTRLRAAVVTDAYSTEATELDWDNATEAALTTLAPAEPRPSQEPVQNARNAVTDGWTIYLPADSDVTAADRLRVRGDDYAVLGEPAVWIGAGIVVQCERVEG
jgi:head-tail adaptor